MPAQNDTRNLFKFERNISGFSISYAYLIDMPQLNLTSIQIPNTIFRVSAERHISKHLLRHISKHQYMYACIDTKARIIHIHLYHRLLCMHRPKRKRSVILTSCIWLFSRSNSLKFSGECVFALTTFPK